MPGAKMVVDVVQVIATTVATQLRKVVQFVCGNTLVCETVKEARSMAFDGQERFKVNFPLLRSTNLRENHKKNVICHVYSRQCLLKGQCLKSQA